MHEQDKRQSGHNLIKNKESNIVDDFLYGLKKASSQYKLLLKPTKSCYVELQNSTGMSILRFDGPHKGRFNYPHMNINPKVNTYLKIDPHLPIGGRLGLGLSFLSGLVLKAIQKILYFAYVALSLDRLGRAITKDNDHSTSRNTSEAVISLVGSWAGASLGAPVGGCLGSMVFPGIGTCIGVISGAAYGSHFLSEWATESFNYYADLINYDVARKQMSCLKCKKPFRCRFYQRRYNGSCDDCSTCNCWSCQSSKGFFDWASRL